MDKNKLFVKNLYLSVLCKGVSYFLYVVSIPLYVKYFFPDNETTGAWFAIISTCLWLLTFDFGVGNGLRNRLVRLIEKNQSIESAHAILAAYLLNLLISIFLVVLCFAFFDFMVYLHFSDFLSNHVYAVKIVVLAISLQFFFRTAIFVLYAQQKSGLIGYFNLFTNLFVYLFLFYAISFGINEDGGIDLLAFVYLLAVNFPLVIYSFYKLLTLKQEILYSFSALSFESIRNNVSEIFSTGMGFFSNQIMYLFITQSASFIIAVVISPVYVVHYTIYSTVFMVGLIFVNMLMTPMWSLITKAKCENDYFWIATWLNRGVLLVTLVGVMELLAFFLFPTIYTIWFGKAYEGEFHRVDQFWFFVYSIALVSQAVVSTFACGLGEMRLQRIYYMMAILSKCVVVTYMVVSGSDFWALIIISDSVFVFLYAICEFYKIRALTKEAA